MTKFVLINKTGDVFVTNSKSMEDLRRNMGRTCIHQVTEKDLNNKCNFHEYKDGSFIIFEVKKVFKATRPEVSYSV